MALSPCPECRRHVLGGESRCPFCNAKLGRRSNSAVAIAFGIGVAMAGCTSDGSVAAYGPPPPTIDGGMDTGVPVDAGTDGRADAGPDGGPDAGGAVTAYGPVPVDAG